MGALKTGILVLPMWLPRLTVLMFLICLFFVISCEKSSQSEINTVFRENLEKKVYSKEFSDDSIIHLLEGFGIEQNLLGVYITSSELGNRYRAQSDFSKAIAYHQQGLETAYKMNDTVDIIQALNNVGTDFRRIGALPEASDYHYYALRMAETFSGRNDSVGRKNRIISINGIGNIHLSFGNYDEAEKAFREALKEEKVLNSHVGQAMNYANIGVIFEERHMYDSAFLYYQRSMEQNLIAESQLGIGLCYIHFGQIYELQKEYEKAEHQYQMAYEIMGNISDTWHWLKACLAIARIRLMKNDFSESKKYIDLAKNAAIRIQSPQRLSEVYNLRYEYNRKQGNFAEALNDFKLSKDYQDSIQNAQKLNRVTDLRVDYERDKNKQYIAQLNIRNEMESRQKKIILIASIVFVLLLLSLLSALFYAYMQRTKSNKMLKNINKLKTNFFTNVTHEFRTPLTVILGLSEYMQGQKNITRNETNSYLKAMDRQGKHLLTLVNQLLDMTKIDAGMDNPEWQKGNIVVYLQMAVDAFRLYAENKKINLFFSAGEPVIEMDFIPHYIDEIVQNLLSNALKFSHPGGEVHVAVSKNKNKEVVLKFSDNGDGIPKEELERVFDLFYQGAQSNQNSGSGIGLNYVRQLVGIMKGKINVDSEQNKGTDFTITLPQLQSEKQVVRIWNPNDEKRALIENNRKHKELPDDFSEKTLPDDTSRQDVRATVLLIEDSRDVQLYIRTLLSPEYNVISAYNGFEGLKLANEIVPDIIVSDIMMPDKDGLSLCFDIRESELLNHIPIILLTAKSTMDDRLKGLKCGADAYIRKPFHADELLVQIKVLIENRRLLKEKYMSSIFKSDALTEKDTNLAFLQKVTDIIYREMQNPNFSSVSLSEKLCMSLSQLNRKLRAISGYTTSLYIINLRIDCAKKKLASENKPIGQIAGECGFYDVAYFARIFKKYTSVTPSQYRRLPK